MSPSAVSTSSDQIVRHRRGMREQRDASSRQRLPQRGFVPQPVNSEFHSKPTTVFFHSPHDPMT
jgi:hypothetical protein